MTKVLDLFSGTHSVGKVCRELGFECTSLDLSGATINCDVMLWDYTTFPKGHFDIVWASPCCVFWSNLRRCNIGRFGITAESIERDIEVFGKPMVDRVFQIINYFKPSFWFIENPMTGRMKDYIRQPYYDVDYCCYCDDPSPRKRTRIWTNLKGFSPKKCNRKTCKHINNGKHIQVYQRGGGSCRNYGGAREIRSVVPHRLIKELFMLV